MPEVLETIGAGEGNRTLVFSLEGFRQPNGIKPHSDKSAPYVQLSAFRFSELSERGSGAFWGSRSIYGHTDAGRLGRFASLAPGLTYLGPALGCPL